VMYNATKRITNVADQTLIASTSLARGPTSASPRRDRTAMAEHRPGAKLLNLDSGLLKDFGITERFKLSSGGSLQRAEPR